ncbi:DEAD/DEAH box helicase [Treponema sp. OttesenSCG-928-L16]|nr:DEAD/DEAH box helicase [Treponema sp. OttesenSCG-928-L16]
MVTDTDISFSSFGLSDSLLDALKRKGFVSPSSIQAIALPRLLLDQGHLVVKARTGTGKTAAFGIPLVEAMAGGKGAESGCPRALILTPTRELALQVAQEIRSFVSSSHPRIAAVYGGAPIRAQMLDLARGTEIVVGTPGRVMDLMERKALKLHSVDWFILDEADEMLDMGFFEDVEKIFSRTGEKRRVALFSATMPEAILKVVREHIGDAEILEDSAPADEKPAVDQYYMVLKREDKLEALRRIMDAADDFYGLVFCATKAGADEVSRHLVEAGYSAEAIHGDLNQEGRERTLRRFRSRMTSVLVATDVAARGIDIERLTHVINWDLPNDRETYVHRIGRTGRAGRRGRAVSFAQPSEQGRVKHLSRSVERGLGVKIEWMPVPPVEEVLASGRKRILTAIMAAAPQPDNAEAAEGGEALPMASDYTETAALLINELGAERTVEALLSLAFADRLDPSRYGPVTEFPKPGTGKNSAWTGTERSAYKAGKLHKSPEAHEKGRRGGRDMFRGSPRAGAGSVRLYVGVGRRHGASARDVAGLLMRAGGVPGRMVDAIEMKDYCAFATMPKDAAHRACAFSRKDSANPLIKPASSGD